MSSVQPPGLRPQAPFWFGLNAWLEKLRGSVRLEEAWPGFGCCLKGMRHQGTQPVPGLGEGQSGAT